MSVTLDVLKTKAEETRKELAELEAAIKVMERIGSAGTGAQATSSEAKIEVLPPLSDTGAINIDELILPKNKAKAKITLMDQVKSVVERLGDQEFTVNHVDAAFKQMGKGSNAKHFKNRLSILIRKLTEQGILERTYKGKGADPHKYRRRQKVNLVKKM